MSEVKTENLTAVSGANATDILGNVVWYSIGKGLITPKELKAKLLASGLGEVWMPKPIRVVDAFRRATNFKKRMLFSSPYGKKKYSVNEVDRSADAITYQLSVEVIDEAGALIEKIDNAGKMTLNLTNGKLNVEKTGDEKISVLLDIRKEFSDLRGSLPKGAPVDVVQLEAALKKASVVNDVPQQSNYYINYMVREVYADKETAIRNLVAETVDQKGKRLDYNSEVGRFILNKKDGTLTVEHEFGNVDAKYFVEEIAKNFDIYKGHYDSQAIRIMVANILKSFAPIALRNNGGVYFVPVSFQENVRRFTRFCDSINEDSNGWKLPVVDTFEERKMVAHTLKMNLRDLHDNCNSSLGQGLKKAQILAIVDDIHKATEDFKEYKSLITEEDAMEIEQQILGVRSMISTLMLEIQN